ncbi:MAG: hypothetical protein FD159_2487, partial [Syntrophaceae bacterium]
CKSNLKIHRSSRKKSLLHDQAQVALTKNTNFLKLFY